MYAFTHVSVEPNLTKALLMTTTTTRRKLSPSSSSSSSINRQLFHPSSLQHHCNLILHALMQLDTSRMMKLYAHPRIRYGDCYDYVDGNVNNSDGTALDVDVISPPLPPLQSLELYLAIVSTDTMLSMPPIDPAEESGQVITGKRYRQFSPGLNKDATDILAFRDPLTYRLVLSEEETREGKSTEKKKMVNVEHHEEEMLLDALIQDHFADYENENENDGLIPKSATTTNSRSLSLGNLVICPEQMVAALSNGRNSKRCNEVGTMDEYVLCALTHSILHLLGYDHRTFEERDEMLVMEKKIARCVAEWLK